MSETRERVRSRDDVLGVLRSHEAELRAMGIERLDLFGSFARDEAGPDSDVDLLADIDRERARLVWARFDVQDEIERLLGREADFVTRIGPGLFRTAICRDLVSVF